MTALFHPMSFKFHLQSSTGEAYRAEVESIVLHSSEGTLELNARNPASYLTLDRGRLEVRMGGKLRHFVLGVTFAGFGRRIVTVLTDRYVEATEPELARFMKIDPSERCAVCHQAVTDPRHGLTIKHTKVSLCCPHCAETFGRAYRVIRRLDARVRGDMK